MIEANDTLTVLLLCCHPALTLASQVALTLRAVGGLTTAEIARAFLVPEATIAQRISRAKQRIKAAGATFDLPPQAEQSQRMEAVLRVLYLIFTEGHTAAQAPRCLVTTSPRKPFASCGKCATNCPTTARWVGCWR